MTHNYIRPQIQKNLPLSKRWRDTLFMRAKSVSGFDFAVGIFFLLLAGVTFVLVQQPMWHADMDAYARANWMYDLVVHHRFVSFADAERMWLPFHPYVLAVMYYVVPDPRLAPKAMSALLSVMSVYLMYQYAKNIFTDKHKQAGYIATLAGLLFAVVPFRIYLSVQPLSETISMFFLLVILQMVQIRRPNYVVFCGILFIAQGIRYEFWYLTPLFFLPVFSDRNLSIRKKIRVLVGMFVFPMLWIAVNYFAHQSPWYFLSEKIFVAQSHSPEIAPFALYPAVARWALRLRDLIGFSGIALSLCGVFMFMRRWRSPIAVFAILVPGVSLSLLILQVYLGTMEFLPQRYLFPVVVGMLPFAAYGIWELISLFTQRSRIAAMVAVVCLSICITADYLWVIKKHSEYVMSSPIRSMNLSKEFTEYYDAHPGLFENKNVYYVFTRYQDWIYPHVIYHTQYHDFIFLMREQLSERKFYSGDVLIISNYYGYVGATGIDQERVTLFENDMFTVYEVR